MGGWNDEDPMIFIRAFEGFWHIPNIKKTSKKNMALIIDPENAYRVIRRGEDLCSKSVPAMAGTNPVAGKVCVVTGGAGSDFLWEWNHRVELTVSVAAIGKVSCWTKHWNKPSQNDAERNWHEEYWFILVSCSLNIANWMGSQPRCCVAWWSGLNFEDKMTRVSDLPNQLIQLPVRYNLQVWMIDIDTDL